MSAQASFCRLLMFAAAYTVCSQEREAVFAWSTGLRLPSVCYRCSGNITADSVVARHCQANDTIGTERRCCVQEVSDEDGNSSRVVIGLDWSRCNLTSLEDYALVSASSLLWLDVSENDLNRTIADRAFGGLIHLTVLALPVDVVCSDVAWNDSLQAENANICTHPYSPCGWQDIIIPHPHNNTPDHPLNISNTELCPVHSECLPDGPGLHQCLCTQGHRGYKCLLKEGNFPYATFFASSVGGALGIIVINWIIRLWISRQQRQTP